MLIRLFPLCGNKLFFFLIFDKKTGNCCFNVSMENFCLLKFWPDDRKLLTKKFVSISTGKKKFIAISTGKFLFYLNFDQMTCCNIWREAEMDKNSSGRGNFFHYTYCVKIEEFQTSTQRCRIFHTSAWWPDVLRSDYCVFLIQTCNVRDKNSQYDGVFTDSVCFIFFIFFSFRYHFGGFSHTQRTSPFSPRQTKIIFSLLCSEQLFFQILLNKKISTELCALFAFLTLCNKIRWFSGHFSVIVNSIEFSGLCKNC